MQIKRIWEACRHYDLTTGDTSCYFVQALAWAKGFLVDISWSPLYTAFYGFVYRLAPDAYLATLLHRLVIVIVLAIMVLALMRFLLPPYIAWLIAAWWVILPINFDSICEVHIFAVILPLFTVLLVLYKPGIWTRGAALGVLLASIVIVRNEIVIAAGLWFIACLVWEIRQARLRLGEKLKVYVLAYGLPVLLAFLAVSFFYSRSPNKPTAEYIRGKHTLNVCQIYSFGYQQRHNDWQKNPWTEGQELMLRDFGLPFPSMFEALRLNPPAMMKHFLWNVRLFPAGLQVALFNATSYYNNPDYAPVQLGMSIVLIPSLLALVLFLAGVILFYRKKRYWWYAWVKARIWGWTLLFCLAAVMVVVVPMQRPRPSYMFLLTILVMAVIGMCLFVTTRSIPFLRRFSPILSVLMIVMPIFTPHFYSTGKRPFLERYKKMAASSEFIGIPETAIVTYGNAQELCFYFTKSIGTCTCVGYGYEVFKNMNENTSVSELLGRQPVPVVVFAVEDAFITDYGHNPSVQAFLANPEREGWKLVSVQDNARGIWRLYVNENKLNIADIKLPVMLE